MSWKPSHVAAFHFKLNKRMFASIHTTICEWSHPCYPPFLFHVFRIRYQVGQCLISQCQSHPCLLTWPIAKTVSDPLLTSIQAVHYLLECRQEDYLLQVHPSIHHLQVECRQVLYNVTKVEKLVQSVIWIFHSTNFDNSNIFSESIWSWTGRNPTPSIQSEGWSRATRARTPTRCDEWRTKHYQYDGYRIKSSYGYH